MFEHTRKLVVIVPIMALSLTACASSAAAEDSTGTHSALLAEHPSDPSTVLEVRATIEAFNDSVGEVDLDSIYELLPEEADVEWEEYKVQVYEESRDHLGEVLAHTDYTGDPAENADEASAEDIDHMVLAFSHVSYFQYAYAFFNDRETPYMVFDNDYIYVDEAEESALVFIVPNESAAGFGIGDFQEYVDMSVNDQRPMELTRSEDNSWIIDADSLAPELAPNYLEVGDEFL